MRNALYNSYVIDASPELTPTIRIAPFCNKNLCLNSDGSNSLFQEYCKKRFGNYYLLPKGRSAIREALSYYHLEHNDIVTILTTSNNFYISSCVTKEIEKVCQWSRIITNKTKIIFVNHEFGYPYSELSSLCKYGLPIIEDCAHTFFSESEDIGKVGDFVIYSLPKAFPVQMGGILVSKEPLDNCRQDPDLASYLSYTLSRKIVDIPSIIQKRLYNFNRFREKLSCIKIVPYFNTKDHTCPLKVVDGFNKV